jgi:hypothetical protein
MKYEMEEIGPKIKKENIDVLENKLSLTLPDPYKEFLLKNNGGRPKPNIAFPIHGWKNNERGYVHYFFGIDFVSEGYKYDLEEEYLIYKDRIPRNLIPIGSTEFGDVIALSMFGSDRENVYIWDHEKEHSPPTYRNIYKIANSFSAFVESLHYYDPLEGVDIESIIRKTRP